MAALGFKSGLLCLFFVCLSAVASTPAVHANEAAAAAPFQVPGCIDGLIKCGSRCCEDCPCR